MRMQYAIYASPGGALLADYSNGVQGWTCATNNRGFAECTGFVPMSLQEAFMLYDRTGLPHVIVVDSASDTAFEGRLEDVAITRGGVNLTALGYARSLSDAPYTALWSTTSVARWRPLISSEIANAFPDRYTTDTNNRLYITAQKNATLGNTGANKVGYLMYQIPDQGSRLITGLSFDYTANAPVNWLIRAISFTAGFAVATTLVTITPGGGPVAGGQKLTFTGVTRLAILHFFYSAGPAFACRTSAD